MAIPAGRHVGASYDGSFSGFEWRDHKFYFGTVTATEPYVELDPTVTIPEGKRNSVQFWQRSADSSYPMTSKFKIKRIKVPFGALERLSAPERYSLFILGHIFNEIMALNRMVLLCQPKDTTLRSNAVQAGFGFNGMFYLRLLAGKLYESTLVLRAKEVSAFLTTHCFPHLKFDGVATLKKFNQKTSKCKWLNAARNGHSMHYPTFEQTHPTLQRLQEGGAGFEFFVGDRHGETLFWSSDVLASAAFASEANSLDHGEGLKQISDDLYEISQLLLKLTAESINAFVVHHWRGDKKYSNAVKVRDVSKFEIPDFSRFELPYFIFVEKLQAAERSDD